jgi:hypothetical protein
MSSSTEETVTKFFTGIFIVIFAAAWSLLWAFPIMWCWNYTMPFIFHLPVITWGMSFCLCLLSSSLIRSSLISLGK